jgi:hypothetical protein
MRKTALAIVMALISTSTLGVANSPAPLQLNYFISGHSLTDEPLPSYLASIAGSLGTQSQWNRQYMIGSPIRKRTRGAAFAESGWNGYGEGQNRTETGLDLLKELRQPATIGAQNRYDSLIITEQNGLFETMLWHDTVRYLRHFHERFIEGNAQGQTFFYEPWSSIDDLDDPSRWMKVEATNAKVWRCVVGRINRSLAHEGRKDRVRSLPVSTALVELLRESLQGKIPDLQAARPRDTVSKLLSDDVHLTGWGAYYMALVTYAVVFDRPPTGAWHPPDVPKALATRMQIMATEFGRRQPTTGPEFDEVGCVDLLKSSAIHDFYTYIAGTWAKSLGRPRAEYRRWSRIINWQIRVRQSGPRNPFHFDPESDRSYWLPPP